MIFSVFCLQFISIVFGTVTNVYDIETVVNSYLSNTIDQHALHATSSDYMQMIQQESNLTPRYFQSVRYILHGFSITNATNDNDKVYNYKKLNFIQSIALYYCGFNMSDVMDTSLDNIFIDESKLLMNSSLFPVQIVESYELIRSEICHRIQFGLYQSVVDMFNPHSHADSFFSSFIKYVANFISPQTHQFFYELKNIGQMYPFLAKFGELELYKETVHHQIWHMDNARARNSALLGNTMEYKIEICMNQIKHPKMHKYVTNILQRQQIKPTGNKSFIVNHYNASNFWNHVEMHQLLTGSTDTNGQVENNTLERGDLLELLDQCYLHSARRSRSSDTVADCTLMTFRMYELGNHKDGTNGHEHVLNAIKCIISNHDIYCLQFSPLTNTTDYEHFNSTFLTRKHHLRQSVREAALYPYLSELMNDTQFVKIINNSTDFDTSLEIILCRLMIIGLEEYKDIEMIQKIVTAFKPKINVCTDCILDTWNKLVMISWMDLLMKHNCMHLTKYFQQRFIHNASETCFS